MLARLALLAASAALVAPTLALVAPIPLPPFGPLEPSNPTTYFQCAATKSGRTESCSSSSPPVVNSTASCCYNGAIVPGGKESGLILQTQFWDAAGTVGIPVSTGPNNSWTIHGLWPDYCDGTYPQYCTAQTGIPAYSAADIDSIIASADPALHKYMEVYYPSLDGNSSGFWQHEQSKHATCFSTLRTECQHSIAGLSKADSALLGYFQEIVKQFRARPTYKWLAQARITPDSTKTYNLTDIQQALRKRYGAIPYLGCTSKNELDEVWYAAHVQGPVINGHYSPIDSPANSSCKATGIIYKPK